MLLASICHAGAVNIAVIYMSNRSVKLSREGIRKASKALKGKNWSKEYLAGHVFLSPSTIHNFFAGKPVERANFSFICEALNLNTEEVADLSQNV